MAILKLIEEVFCEVASPAVQKRRGGYGNASHRTAFTEGYLAAAFGRTVEQCPYVWTRANAAFYHAWHDGHKQAEEDRVTNGFVVVKGVPLKSGKKKPAAKKTASKGRRKVGRPRKKAGQ